MEIKEQFLSGLDMASRSFYLLWQHKTLFIYLGIPTFISILVHFLVDFVVIIPPDKHIGLLLGFYKVAKGILTFPGWIRYIGISIVDFITIFFFVFFNVALIHHTIHIVRDQRADIKEVISSCIAKLRIIVEWSLLSTMVVLILQLISAYAQNCISFGLCTLIIGMVVILSIGWSLLTFFVAPTIAAEHTTLMQAIWQSKEIVSATFIKILGGEFWIGLIAILTFALPHLFLRSSLHSSILIVSSLIIITIGCIISAVHTIFKTLLYRYYKKPLEEITYLRYPRF